jgi:hypothetical protein
MRDFHAELDFSGLKNLNLTLSAFISISVRSGLTTSYRTFTPSKTLFVPYRVAPACASLRSRVDFQCTKNSFPRYDEFCYEDEDECPLCDCLRAAASFS